MFMVLLHFLAVQNTAKHGTLSQHEMHRTFTILKRFVKFVPVKVLRSSTLFVLQFYTLDLTTR